MMFGTISHLFVKIFLSNRKLRNVCLKNRCVLVVLYKINITSDEAKRISTHCTEVSWRKGRWWHIGRKVGRALLVHHLLKIKEYIGTLFIG